MIPPSDKRLFLALPVDLAIASTLLDTARVCCADADKKLYAAQDLHLTIKFFGAVATTKIEQLKQHIKMATNQVSSFSVELKKLSFFSGRHHCVMIALSRLSLPLATLYREINISIQSCGYSVEQKVFRPHVTLLRDAKGMSLIRDEIDVSFNVEELVLYESLKSQDQRFRVVERFALG